MNEFIRRGKHKTEWITISLDEYESMKRTIEVLSDEDLMSQMKEDVKVFDFEKLARELEI